MKGKKLCFLAAIAGFLEIAAGFILPITVAHASGGIDIIGGADFSTYFFIANLVLDGLPMCLILLGVALLISAAFCAIFYRTVTEHCTVKTTLLSLGLSVSGAVGIGCFFVWYSIAAFHEMSKHPIEYPLSITIGMLCLAVFILLLVLYCSARKGKWSAKGVIIDILTSLLYLLVFFYIFGCCHEWISSSM